MTVSIRPATAEDQQQIRTLARGERIKPVGLNWPNFIVAEEDGRIIGAVQLRAHADGSRELGSLVVASAFRGRGVAARLIERRLADAAGRVLIITGGAYSDYYHRWGFRRIRPVAAPPCIWLNYWIGYLGGGLMSLLQRRRVNHLAVLERI